MRDEFGFPGFEEYDINEFEEVRAFVYVAFKAFGYSWQHDRVKAYLAKVEAIVKRPVKTGHQLPYKHYKLLALCLAAEVVEWREARRKAVDQGALLMASALVKTNHQLAGTKS